MKTKLTILFLISFSVLSCKLEGTDTGNPLVDPNQGQCGKMNKSTGVQMSCVLSPIPLEQVWAICTKLNSCRGVDRSTCSKIVQNQPELSKELDVPFDTYAALHSEYQKRKVAVDVPLFNSCMKAIDELDCHSSVIQNAVAIDNSNPDTVLTNYSNVHSILTADPSCKSVYSLKN